MCFCTGAIPWLLTLHFWGIGPTLNAIINLLIYVHYSKKLKEHFDIMIFIERYPLKRCQGCVKLIASKVNCFLNINDLSEVQLCMSSNSWTWECPHTKDGADHVPWIFLSSVYFTSVFFTVVALYPDLIYMYSRYIFRTCIKCHFFSYIS